MSSMAESRRRWRTARPEKECYLRERVAHTQWLVVNRQSHRRTTKAAESIELTQGGKAAAGDIHASQRIRDRLSANQRAENSTAPDRQIPADGADPETVHAFRSQLVKSIPSLLKAHPPARRLNWNILSNTPNSQAVPSGKRASRQSGCAATEALRTVCSKIPSDVKRILRQPQFIVISEDEANCPEYGSVHGEKAMSTRIFLQETRQ